MMAKNRFRETLMAKKCAVKQHYLELFRTILKDCWGAPRMILGGTLPPYPPLFAVSFTIQLLKANQKCPFSFVDLNNYCRR